MSRWKFILSLSVIAFELFALCHCKEMEMEMDLRASYHIYGWDFNINF